MLKTVSSVANAIGALNYKGTWNATTNTPALASGVGTQGDYYVVSVTGATDLDGTTNWGVGDWATFNGSVWQRVEGGADGNFVNLEVTGTSKLTGNVGIGIASGSDALTVNDANGIPIRFGDIASAPATQTACYVGVSTGALAGNNGDLVLVPRTTDSRSILFYTGLGTSALAMDIGANKDVTIAAGNLVIGTSGNGIDFSATAGTGTSELLDDYEEGAWTATLTGSTAAPTTPITTTGTYTKFGRAVTVTCSFNAVSLSGSTGTVEITGLPFLVGSQDCHGTCGNNGLSGGSLMCTAVSGLTLLSVRSLDTTVFTPTVAGTVYVLASITYFV
jgi:hypothetical protein